MSTSKTGNQYDEEFKRALVNLYQSSCKSQSALCKEYGVSATALGRWIKQYSTVETDDGEVLTAKQVKELQKRNAQLEEKLLCKVLGVNRSTYYKHYHSEPATRTSQNQEIAKKILQIYADYNKRFNQKSLNLV